MAQAAVCACPDVVLYRDTPLGLQSAGIAEESVLGPTASPNTAIRTSRSSRRPASSTC
jgi:hypothetical protein